MTFYKHQQQKKIILRFSLVLRFSLIINSNAIKTELNAGRVKSYNRIFCDHE